MKPSPTILALVTDAFGGRGGIAQYNRDFLGTLACMGAASSITILPRYPPDLNESMPEAIEQMRARPGRAAYAVAAIRTALCRSIDIVFCGHLFIAPLAALIARLKGAKLIVQTHGIEAWPRPTWLQRIALESADLVLCVSRHTRARVLAWASIAPERVVTLPNTIGDAFTPGDGSALRSELGLQGKQVLLTVGRLDSRERYKGHDRVILLLSKLIAQGHDVVYVVVGEGDDRSRLEKLALEAGLDARVHFLGSLKRKQLVDAYRMADLFVMPSTGEGFGIVYVEAMASGTPALGLDAVGARDALADGELGMVASAEEFPVVLARLLGAPRPDPTALATAVRARFGQDAFAARACATLQGCWGTRD